MEMVNLDQVRVLSLRQDIEFVPELRGVRTEVLTDLYRYLAASFQTSYFANDSEATSPQDIVKLVYICESDRCIGQ